MTTDPPNNTRSASRRPGEGSIDRLPSGKVRVRIVGPDGVRRSKVFRSEVEAEQFRAGTVSLYAETPDAFEETVGSFGAAWLDRRELAGEHRSVDKERVTWRNHVEGSELASRPLTEVSRRDVKAWLDGMKAKKAMIPVRKGKAKPTNRPLSRSVITHALVLLRQCFKAALDDERIEENPAKEIKLGRRVAATHERWTFLAVDEIARLLDCAAIPETARIIYAVAIHSGLRQGELWGLRWDDVHLDGDRPHLVVRYSHKGPTKNGKIRHVPLLEPARAALERWKARCPLHVDRLVFPSIRGERRCKGDDAGWSDWSARSKKHAGRGHKTLAGIARDVRFHDLRHTCASHLVMGTWGRAWKLEEVRDFLGHSSVTVTEMYAHLSPDHLHLAAAETRATGAETRAPVTTKPSDPGSRATAPESLESRETPSIQAVGRLGIEPRTYGLKDPAGSQSFRAPALPYDPIVTRDAAMALLAAAATGDAVSEELIDNLVDAVLGTPAVRLALGARESGPQRLVLALRLAAACAQAFDAWERIKAGSNA